MHFGKTLKGSIFTPWKDKYIDYAKLQKLLREDESDEDGTPWTEEDERNFCDEIFNVQLEKVAQFQQERFDALKQRVDDALNRLGEVAPGDKDGKSPATGEDASAHLKELKSELDEIIKEVRELKRYSNINYTGFLKIVKKHDRKRRNLYPIRPMTQLRLAERPFNSESSYRPLLDKLHLMYSAIREQVDTDEEAPVDLDNPAETHNGERYTAYKFWIHPDNLLEVETFILPRLPALVYSQQSAKELDGNEAPSITSLYFDNNDFEIYSDKVNRQSETSSLRLRWYGQLSSRPDIYVEQKTADAHGNSQELKFVIKDKNVKGFISGEDVMEKKLQKMERQGQQASQIESLRKTTASIQNFLRQKHLAPVLRANYMRRAFQKPADDRVRISIDSDLAFIREDTLDEDRPCRDPQEWHRLDIDENNLKYPFKNINQSEVARFPYSVLEIKLKEDKRGKRPSWIEELMSSHLVHPAPRFSKFVHGVASLFEDHVNNLPMWLSDLQSDIRKDPQQAFEEEEQRRAQRAEDAMVVGSLIGTLPSSYQAAKSSPVGKSYLADRMSAESRSKPSRSQQQDGGEGGGENGESNSQAQQQESRGYGTLSKVIPGFSGTRYSRARRARAQEVTLPEGVVEPEEWIKNKGELKIEPKVWLANERTFLKWQHISILQGGLAVALYSAAGRDTIALAMGVVYFAIAVFAGGWGYYMLHVRRNMIIERSGKDFDNMIGPLIIAGSLMSALIINFVLQYRAAIGRMSIENIGEPITDELFKRRRKVTIPHPVVNPFALTSGWMAEATDQADRRGFWGGLLRRGSLARHLNRLTTQDNYIKHGDDGAAGPNGSRAGLSDYEKPNPRRRPRRPSPAPPPPDPQARLGTAGSTDRSSKGVGWKEGLISTRDYGSMIPLTKWPPTGVSSLDDLPPQHAMELITKGASTHTGHRLAVPHAPDHCYALYTTSQGNRCGDTDAADLYDVMVSLMTMRMRGAGHASAPWETLEQPSYSFYYGQQPGTITLNQWAFMASALPQTIALRDSGVLPRDMSLERVLERLRELQSGLEDDDEDLLYRILYKRMLKDPERLVSPHRTLDKQITDLIVVLSRPDWIDFTNPKNQVVTRFIFNKTAEDQGHYHKFFHQLLLSLELDLRIHSAQHSKLAKERLLRQIPPTIQWNLALARRWRDYVRVLDWGETPEDTVLRYKLRRRQVKALKQFAQTMKWPNLAETLDNLKAKDEEMSLGSISSDTFAFFSGLVLPGPTFPFLIMNTLIDLDPDPATDDLALLSHMHPNCGFQYRSSYTYWSASSIVGKVLAPTCATFAGWVGPGRPTADLSRSQIARVRCRRPRQQLRAEDVESMAERSDPLGPPAESYPVNEYALPKPARSQADMVRIELLGFKPVEERTATPGPQLYDATIQFAIQGLSWPLRLMYDVSFISAWPCSDGPHPLFFDYAYQAVQVDKVVGVRDWGRLYGSHGSGSLHRSARSSPVPGSLAQGFRRPTSNNGTTDDGDGDDDGDDEKVLLVEAFGVRDNEVLARAWCSHWGLSAVVADIRKTCIACAIREAYAATLTVVILVEGQPEDTDE
ncbi:hypothetical protein S7711_07311 [Stachybotrys chartarum IBT 7711]|uniref:SPX domain-containing protein n=1 Tax=Stachybotrys chartarum (strain CBS 109288 / IBT 7711) TaxID=1280523 RepID=A0A084AZF6_STACB|nr:hypothetical protein S7711_07311 [Stachybotrys chartarum IBT 7711]